MNVTAQWDNVEHTAMRCIVAGEWGCREFGDILTYCFDVIRRIGYKVDLVIDLHHAHYVRRGDANTSIAVPAIPANCGLIVALSNDQHVHVAMSMFRQTRHTAGARLLCTSDDEETHALLKNLTATRPPERVVALPA